MLAYWTAVAIVPLFVLAFALTGPLGLQEATQMQVRALLYDTVLAGAVGDVAAALDAFLTSANLGALGLVGVVGLLTIGAQLYFNAELAYNDVFGTRVRRTRLYRFTMFYAGLTLGPLLIAAGFLATARIANREAVDLASRALPVLLTAVVLVGAIRLLPCTVVSWRAALLGGLLAAVLFEAAKIGFSAYTDILGTRDRLARIYGSVAFVPVFLLWLYVLWFVVLIGVEVAWFIENQTALVDAQRRRATDPHAPRRRPDGFFALDVMGAIAERFRAGGGAITADDVARILGAEPRHVLEALDQLADAGLVAAVGVNGWLPARPVDALDAADVLRAWRDVAAPEGGASLHARTAEAALRGPIAPRRASGESGS
jgi:membrane protein